MPEFTVASDFTVSFLEYLISAKELPSVLIIVSLPIFRERCGFTNVLPDSHMLINIIFWTSGKGLCSSNHFEKQFRSWSYLAIIDLRPSLCFETESMSSQNGSICSVILCNIGKLRIHFPKTSHFQIKIEFDLLKVPLV